MSNAELAEAENEAALTMQKVIVGAVLLYLCKKTLSAICALLASESDT